MFIWKIWHGIYKVPVLRPDRKDSAEARSLEIPVRPVKLHHLVITEITGKQYFCNLENSSFPKSFHPSQGGFLDAPQQPNQAVHWKTRELGKGTGWYLSQRYHRHNVFSDELAFSNVSAGKPLHSCTENSGTRAPVKQYHSAPPHQLICLTGNAPGEQGGCLKDSGWGQRKACELNPEMSLGHTGR